MTPRWRYFETTWIRTVLLRPFLCWLAGTITVLRMAHSCSIHAGSTFGLFTLNRAAVVYCCGALILVAGGRTLDEPHMRAAMVSSLVPLFGNVAVRCPLRLFGFL